VSTTYLLADIGGTNARFALSRDGQRIGASVERVCADYAGMAPLLRDAMAAFDDRPDAAVLAVAAPVLGDEVTLTNLSFTFSQTGLAQELGLSGCTVLNDFAAMAWSLPTLAPDTLDRVGGAAPVDGAAKAVLGPGTGLGVSALIPTAQGWTPVSGEGGHASLSSEDDFEAALLARLHKDLDHVSYEAVLSGPGLVRLHEAIIDVAGLAAMWSVGPAAGPADVTRRAAEEPGGPAGQAVAVFCRLLGAYAGDLALIFGARGGVYIGGGIVPKLGPLFDREGFRRRFDAKGRFQGYLTPIPVFVIRAEYPALDGLANYVGTL